MQQIFPPLLYIRFHKRLGREKKCIKISYLHNKQSYFTQLKQLFVFNTVKYFK
jgi:hypothetical protein